MLARDGGRQLRSSASKWSGRAIMIVTNLFSAWNAFEIQHCCNYDNDVTVKSTTDGRVIYRAKHSFLHRGSNLVFWQGRDPLRDSPSFSTFSSSFSLRRSARFARDRHFSAAIKQQKTRATDKSDSCPFGFFLLLYNAKKWWSVSSDRILYKALPASEILDKNSRLLLLWYRLHRSCTLYRYI